MNPPPPKPSTAMTDEQETSTGQPTRVPAGAPIARVPAGEGTAKTGRRVTVESLSAYYGGQQAVKDLSIEFAPNQVTAIIGPSGCGKSTLVRCLNRMHEEIPGARATGSVRLDEQDVYAPSVDVVSVRRTVGMVFQKPNPFPTMSIHDKDRKSV